MNEVFKIRINKIINELPREFRASVAQAADHSDGTYLSFQEELAAQAWEYPELPVEDILQKVAFDV